MTSEQKALLALSICDKNIRKMLIALLVGELLLDHFRDKLDKELDKLREELPRCVDFDSIERGYKSEYSQWAVIMSVLGNACSYQVGDYRPSRECISTLLKSDRENDKPLKKEIIAKLNGLAKFEPTAIVDGKKVNSYEKVPIDLRHYEKIRQLQMEMGLSKEQAKDLFGELAEYPTKGGKKDTHLLNTISKPKGDLFEISHHSGCSDRCHPDERKIVSASLPSINSKMETGKTIDGKPIYSLKAMLARKDKYGWHNFILVGFNCKHHLHPYGTKTTTEEREVPFGENGKRYLEKYMRMCNRYYETWKDFDHDKAEKKYLAKYKKALRKYIEYCEHYDLEPEVWKCDI